MNIHSAVEKMVNLSDQNLKLLSDINKAFVTDKAHIVTQIGDSTYHIPSFINLENKINHLQWAFENLVRSPQHGEAWFNFDGNSRVIDVRGYQQTPPPIKHTSIEQFSSSVFDGFKDMLSPKPVVKIDCSSLPDDTREIVVKKVIFYDTKDVKFLPSKVSAVVPYSQVRDWMNDRDLEMGSSAINTYYTYDAIYTLPMKDSSGYGTYTIKAINSERYEPEQIVEVVIYDDLIYVDANYMDNNLQKGMLLTNWEGTSQMEILEVDRANRTLLLKVKHGEYMNLVPHDGSDNDYSKLRFFKPNDFSKDKYLNIPLEEDQYVYISIAPLNTRLNMKSMWSDGVMINTHKLTNQQGETFKEYYDKYVKNIGDILQEITAIAPNAITRFNPSQIEQLKVLKVNDNEVIRDVRHTNSHIYNADLADKIKTLRDDIGKLENDNTGDDEAKKTREEQVNALKSKLSSAIASSQYGIDEPEYNILLWVDTPTIIGRLKDKMSIDLKDVSHIEVRYRRANIFEDKATDFTNNTLRPYRYSDWVYIKARPFDIDFGYKDGKYEVDVKNTIEETDTNTKNNEVWVPIRPAERIDLQVRLCYRFGQPYTNMTSMWSDTIVVRFPDNLMPQTTIMKLLEDTTGDMLIHKIKQDLTNSTWLEDNKKKFDEISNNLITQLTQRDATINDIKSEYSTLEQGLKGFKAIYDDIKAKIDILEDKLTSIPDVKVRVGANEQVWDYRKPLVINHTQSPNSVIEIDITGGVLYEHYVDTAILDSNHQRQGSNVVLFLDKYMSGSEEVKLERQFKLSPIPRITGATGGTVRYVDATNNPYKVSLAIEDITRTARSEVAMSIKYDHMKDPIIYILTIINNGKS